MDDMDKFSLSDPEKVKKFRLEALCDCILYNLKSEGFEFNKEEVREKLSRISSETQFCKLQKLAAKANNLHEFFLVLNDELCWSKNIKVNIVDSNNEAKKTCLCCGYITLTSEIHDICPICFWQDDPACWDDADTVWDANGISLREAQRNFREFGTCEKVVLDCVRPPSEDDKRDPNWKQYL